MFVACCVMTTCTWPCRKIAANRFTFLLRQTAHDMALAVGTNIKFPSVEERSLMNFGSVMKKYQAENKLILI